MQYADFRNRTTLLRMLEEPAYTTLALSFLQIFSGLKVAKVSGNTYANSLFMAKGAFNDDLELVITDDIGIKHLVHVRFFELHLGITDGYFEIETNKWRDLKMHAQTTGFGHSFCQTVRELCFFSFNYSQSTHYYSARQYDFEELPLMVRFECYELNKFNSENNVSEKDIWLQIIKNGFESVLKFPKTSFIILLKKVFDMRKWDKVGLMFYESRQKYKHERGALLLQKYLDEDISLDEKFLEKSSQKADWNWDILEKQLGKLPKNRVKPSAINLQNFENNLPKLAFDLFRKWTKKCLEKYPNIDLTIIDERKLVADVENQIRESLIAIFNHETFYRRNRSKKYATDFFIGHLEGSLGKHWYTEYLVKTKDEFKTVMVLKSLKLFLDLEDVMRIRAEEIYREVMKSKVNLSNPNLDIAKIDLKSSSTNELIEANEATTNIQAVLVNLSNEYVHKLGKMEAEDFELEVAELLDENTVDKFIEVNWNLFLP